MTFLSSLPQYFWRRLSPELRKILGIFAFSRAVYLAIGTFSLRLYAPFPMQDSKFWIYYPHELWLKMWGIWDSGWYLDIAQRGYQYASTIVPSVQMNIGFFPLYPAAVGFLGNFFLWGNVFIAGLIVSNVAFIAGLYYLYKLLRLDYSEKFSDRCILFMFLMPTAFIFSGVFAESLFFFLSIFSIYQARKGNWLAASLTGFLVAMTKSFGFLVLIPLTYLYLSEKKFRLAKIKADVLYFILIPLGTLSFFLYLKLITGNFFAYSEIQQAAWGHQYANPFVAIILGLLSSAPASTQINCLYASILILALLIWHKRIPAAYWLYSMSVLLFVPFTGGTVGFLRYGSSLFPLAILASSFFRKEDHSENLKRSSSYSGKEVLFFLLLALIQGALLVFWVNGFWFVS